MDADNKIGSIGAHYRADNSKDDDNTPSKAYLFKLDIDEKIKVIMEAKFHRENIFCPFCDHKQDNETKYHFVTYWGEDGAKECMCEHCNKTFFVKEVVERTFICKKTEEAFND